MFFSEVNGLIACFLTVLHHLKDFQFNKGKMKMVICIFEPFQLKVSALDQVKKRFFCLFVCQKRPLLITMVAEMPFYVNFLWCKFGTNLCF